MEKVYKNCYIAFLDILGFKRMVDTMPCSEIYEIYSKRMKNSISRIYLGKELCFDMSDIKIKVMSDSICFYVDSSKSNALAGLIVACEYFQEQLLRLSNPILTRGAIVKGDIFTENDIIYGPGFVKAYLMEENNAKYPRIIMTKETIDSAKELTTEQINHIIPMFTFSDFDAFYTIDYWSGLNRADSQTDYSRILTHVDHILDTTTDTSVREKYLYMRKNLQRCHIPGKSSAPDSHK